MIPKLSAPLTKAIRTSEGVIVWVIGAALGIASAIPSTHLTTKEAGILASGIAALHVISRTALKGVALIKGVDPALTPITFKPPTIVTNAVKEVPAVVGQVENDVSAITDAQEIASPPPVEAPPVAVGA